MIMSAGLKVQLRVLIPAVENSVSRDAYRPSDVLASRKGITVEVGNTDAEGRLVMADEFEDQPLELEHGEIQGCSSQLAFARAPPRAAVM